MIGWRDNSNKTGKDVAFYLGRFNPIHIGHMTIIDAMLDHNPEVAIFAIGGATGARTFKNPWSFSERSVMLNLAITDLKRNRAARGKEGGENTQIRIIGIPDYISDHRWKQDIKARIETIVDENDHVQLFGYAKDSSSYYLGLFPEWSFVEVGMQIDIDATTVREKIYKDEFVKPDYSKGDINLVSESVFSFIDAWQNSDEFNALRKEWKFIQDYKKQFEGLKYKPVFVTVDALFITDDKHVVLIKRKEYPGLGMLAMPGGFVDPNLTLRQSLDKIIEKKLKINISGIKHTRMEVIDNPDRSLRGRTLTNVFVFENFGHEGNDIQRYSIGNLAMYRQQMFEDHFMIIDHLLY